MRCTRFFSLLTASTLALLNACGDGADDDKAGVDVDDAIAQHALLADLQLRVRAPLAGPRLSSPAAIARTPIDVACLATASCNADQLDRFPIFPIGQRLDLPSLFSSAGTPSTVDVRLISGAGGAARDLNLLDNTIGCLSADVCVGNAIDLQSIGRGLHELQFMSSDGTTTVTHTYPLRVVDFAGAATIVIDWMGVVASADPTGIALDTHFIAARNRVLYARDVFELNPIAAFSLVDDAAAELFLASTDTFFTTDLDPAIDLLTRARFFTAHGLIDGTLAERGDGDTWDLLSDDDIDSPSFPFNGVVRPFIVDEQLVLAELGLANDGIDVVADALAARDLIDNDAVAAVLAAGSFQTFTADAQVRGSIANGDEDYIQLTNPTDAPIVVRAETVGTCRPRGGDDPVLVLYDLSGAFLDRNDDGAGEYCSLLQITVPANASRLLGVIDFSDDGQSLGWDLVLDFPGASAVVPVDELEPNDDGFVSISNTDVGNDFTLAPGGGTAGIAALRNDQIVGTTGTFTRLLEDGADAVPALRAAAILDGDDIMASLLNRPSRRLSIDAGRLRRIYDNDAPLGLEPAYGRFALAAVRDAVNDTLALNDRGLLTVARVRLQQALVNLDTVSTALAGFPEAFNTSNVATGTIGANEKLMTEVYLASQEALTALRAVQGSTIDTTAWQAGIALGLASVSRFSAFTGARPMSEFRGTSAAVAAFECRFGKTLLNLQAGDHAAANSLFSRSVCQLIDIYNEQYAAGSLTDPLRIPDDKCIDANEYDCPRLGTYANGCDRVDARAASLAAANDPGWGTNQPSNCGLGSIYAPQPVAFPGSRQFALPESRVEPEPFCVIFDVVTRGPLTIRTLGSCEIDEGDTELSLFGDDIEMNKVDTGDCDEIALLDVAPGQYVACAGNRSASTPIADVTLTVEANRACDAGSVDHDANPATACQACAPGDFCAGGSAPRVICTQSTPIAFDHDLSPATACRTGLFAGSIRTGDGNDNLPVGNGANMDITSDANGNIYAMTSWGGSMTMHNTVLSATPTFAGAIQKILPDGTVDWFVHFDSNSGARFLPGKLVTNADGQLFVYAATLGGGQNVKNFVRSGASFVIDQTTVVSTGGGAVEPGVLVAMSTSTGRVQWSQRLSQNRGTTLVAIAVDNDGNPVLASPLNAGQTITVGGTTLTARGQADAYLMSFAKASGTPGTLLQQVNSVGSTGLNVVSALTVTSGGDWVVSGTLTDGATSVFGTALTATTATPRSWFARVSPAGVVRHVRTLGVGTEAVETMPFDMKADRTDGFYVLGRFESGGTFGSTVIPDGNRGYFVGRYDSSASQTWFQFGRGGGGVQQAFSARRLVVDKRGTVDLVRTMLTGLVGTTVTSIDGTFTLPGPTNATVVYAASFDGDTGGTSLGRYVPIVDAGGNTPLFGINAMAINPVSGNGTFVGSYFGAPQIDNLLVQSSLGGRDHIVVRMAF